MGLQRIRLSLCLFQDGRATANLTITFAHFVNDLWRGGTMTAHVQQIWFDLIKIIGTAVRHYQYTDHGWGAFHFSIIFPKGGLNLFALKGNQPSSARTACSLSSVEPQTRVAPSTPTTTDSQSVEMKR